jgi:hypothetical protein
MMTTMTNDPVRAIRPETVLPNYVGGGVSFFPYPDFAPLGCLGIPILKPPSQEIEKMTWPIWTLAWGEIALIKEHERIYALIRTIQNDFAYVPIPFEFRE